MLGSAWFLESVMGLGTHTQQALPLIFAIFLHIVQQNWYSHGTPTGDMQRVP
jgi:hypothetical protein